MITNIFKEYILTIRTSENSMHTFTLFI